MIASASNLGSGVIGIIVGVATFLFLATSAIIELQDDLNIIWKANLHRLTALASSFARAS